MTPEYFPDYLLGQKCLPYECRIDMPRSVRPSEKFERMAKYFAYEAEMPAGGFRESAFRENFSSELLLFACRTIQRQPPGQEQFQLS